VFGHHSSHHTRALATRAVALTAVAAGAAVFAPNAADGAVVVTPDAVISATHDLWHMDEASGTAMTDATGNHPGSLHTVELAQIGVASTGYRFNGTSSYVRIPNAADLNAGPRDVHIAFSMNTTTVPAVPDYDLFRKGQAPGQEYKVELQPDGSVTCYFKGDLGSTTATSAPGLQDGKWHDIRCEKFSSSVVLTVDGTKYTKSKAVGSISNDFDMIVGAYPTGDFYRGLMDELSFSIDGDLVAPPTASFTATPDSGAAPLDVTFKDTSTGTPTSWSWSFGDNSSSTAQNPTHRFSLPGTYTVTLTARNEGGSTTATKTVSVQDVTAPVGSYTVSTARAAASSTTVTLQQQSLSDDFTPASGITRRVSWGDGSAAFSWTTGTTTTHVFRAAGSFTPQVTLVDAAGNARTVSAPTVSVSGAPVARDTSAPSVWLVPPATSRSSVSSWRVLRGASSDGSGTGVRFVTLRVIEKRGATWFAYRAGSHSWVRATSRAAALRRASATRVIVSSANAFQQRLFGLRRGVLEVRFTATDRAGNRSGTHLVSRRLVRP
jgi:PKD repeat protein